MKVIESFLSAGLGSLFNLPSENCLSHDNCIRSLSFGAWAKNMTATTKVSRNPHYQFQSWLLQISMMSQGISPLSSIKRKRNYLEILT